MQLDYVLNYINTYYHLYDYEYNDELQTYDNGEVEYQLRTTFSGGVYSILVRFKDDNQHIYRELFLSEFEDLSQFLDAVFDDNILEEMNLEFLRKLS